MRKRNLLVLGISAMLIFGCSGPSIETYDGTSPRFDIAEYFNGTHEGWGMLRDWKGKVTRRFRFTMKGEASGKNLTLNEAFEFDDGEKQTRTWQMVMKDDHTFSGVASDGVGTAEGKQYGNAVEMEYTLNVPVDGKTMTIDFDDWLFLQENGVVLNETRLKKFGLTVGKLTIVIRKLS